MTARADGREVARTPDGKVRIRLYVDGSIRLTIVRGTRYALRQMWFSNDGGNILLMPVEGTGEPFSGSVKS
jgi:hypothetical protein